MGMGSSRSTSFNLDNIGLLFEQSTYESAWESANYAFSEEFAESVGEGIVSTGEGLLDFVSFDDWFTADTWSWVGTAADGLGSAGDAGSDGLGYFFSEDTWEGWGQEVYDGTFGALFDWVGDETWSGVETIIEHYTGNDSDSGDGGGSDSTSLPNPWEWTENSLSMDNLAFVFGDAGNTVDFTAQLAAFHGYTDATAGGASVRAFENAVDGLEHVLPNIQYALDFAGANAGAAFLEEAMYAGYAVANSDTRTGVESSADTIQHLVDGSVSIAEGLMYEMTEALKWTGAEADYVYYMNQANGHFTQSQTGNILSHYAISDGEGYDLHISMKDGWTSSGSHVRDDMYAYGTHSVLNSGYGDDILHAYGGQSVINAGDGNDIATVLGDGNNIRLDAGDDILTASGSGQFWAGDGNDVMNLAVNYSIGSGGAGDDDITVFGHSNNFAGGDGDDTMSTAGDHNVLRGEAGNDVLGAVGTFHQLFGQTGHDIIHVMGDSNLAEGGTGNDFITAAGYDNEIYGDEGDDTMTLSGTNSEAYGGSGHDLIHAMGEHHKVVGGTGDDVLTIHGANSNLYGEDGDDFIRGVGENLALVGGDGNDLIISAGDSNRLFGDYDAGASGDDAFVVNGNYNQVYGEAGNDSIDVTGDSNVVEGGDGNDMIMASGNYNRIDGGADSDLINVTGYDNEVLGGAGNDAIVVKGSNSEVYGGTGNDAIDVSGNHQKAVGGDGDDYINITGNNSNIYGVDGNDMIQAEGHGLALVGGDGNDIVSAEGNSNRIFGDYDAHATGEDTLVVSGDSNQLWGEASDDFVAAVGIANVVDGGDGDDVVVASGDGSQIIGGAGDDLLLGGDGSETFVYNKGDGWDTLINTGGTADVIEINGFDNLQVAPEFAADGSSLTILFSEGADQPMGGITIDLANGQQVNTLRLDDGYEMDLAPWYDPAATSGNQGLGNDALDAAEIADLAASLDAALDDADLANFGEFAEMVVTPTGDTSLADPTDDEIVA